MKAIFKEAHKMTREIKEEYSEVDYQAQFGLCLSFLFEETKGDKGMKINFAGTEKQIKYATNIEKGFIFIVEELGDAIEKYSKSEKMKNKYTKIYNEEIKPLFESYENAGDFIGDWKHMLDRKHKSAKIRILVDTLKEREGIRVTERIVGGLQDEYLEEEYQKEMNS